MADCINPYSLDLFAELFQQELLFHGSTPGCHYGDPSIVQCAGCCLYDRRQGGHGTIENGLLQTILAIDLFVEHAPAVGHPGIIHCVVTTWCDPIDLAFA